MPIAFTLGTPTIYPPLLVATGLLGVILLGLRRTASASSARFLGCASLLVGIVMLAQSWEPWSNELVRWDGPAHAWGLLFFVAALPLMVLMEIDSEMPVALALGAVLGMTILASANHLFVLFLGLEIMSLSTYLLIAGARRDRRALEATIKYFFSGSLAAALYLFGLSVFYAATGSMGMDAHADAPGVQLGLLLMLCAAIFKVGGFPMHFWLPDAYEAAAPELAGFMSTAVKAAGFLLMLRLAAMVVPGRAMGFEEWLPWIAGATMTIGNLLALRQERLQRLLAYSSISHVGYLLAGVWAWLRLGAAAEGAATTYFYLLVYLFMNTGAFLFVHVAGVSELRQLKGFAARSSRLAGFFALMLLSLAAIPPTGGFLAKFYIIWDVIRAGGVGLAVAVALNSVLGVAYYFKLVKIMVLDQPESGAPVLEMAAIGWSARIALWGCMAATVILGLLPNARSLLGNWLNG